MSQINLLLQVTRSLKAALPLAEDCSDRLLLYLIDMAILEACETIAAASASEPSPPTPQMTVAFGEDSSRAQPRAFGQGA